jgi:hypothetical protein
VATSKLASDLSSGSKKPEPVSSVSRSEIYSWASQLASESRKLDWVFYWYVWPDSVREIIHKLETMSGGIIGLVGFQGVGKSSALLAILAGRMLLQQMVEAYRKGFKAIEPFTEDALLSLGRIGRGIFRRTNSHKAHLATCRGCSGSG